MKAKTRQNIVIALLPVAMIWGAYNLFWVEKKPRSQPAEQEVASLTPEYTETNTVVRDRKYLERIRVADWGTDPFKSVIKQKVKPTDKSKKTTMKLILSGIVFNDRSPMAVINKKMVRSGDAIGDARVVTIDPKSVLMERNGKQFRLKVTKG